MLGDRHPHNAESLTDLCGGGDGDDDDAETLLQDNPGLRSFIEQIWEENGMAIEAKMEENFGRCIQHLERGLSLRKDIFHVEDPEFQLPLKHLISTLNDFAVFSLMMGAPCSLACSF